MQTELLEVDLPVCPNCGIAGKIPRKGAEGKVLDFYCTGPKGHKHKRIKMEYRKFREVENVTTG